MAALPETQLSRYGRLAEHVDSLERTVGEIRVRFESTVPADLLARTLHTERRCCEFVRTHYNEHSRILTINVDKVDQAPRLDSLAWLLQPGGSDSRWVTR